MTKACFIGGEWRAGGGVDLTSTNPVDGSTIWEGPCADAGDVTAALDAARTAQPGWEDAGRADRIAIIERFAEVATARRAELADVIATETGKARWEADTEVATVIAKAAVSIEAYAERTPSQTVGDAHELTHRPLGIVGVLGPYNFPAHLPNGQIIPALLAGNAVVYKPSELTPAVAAAHVSLFEEAGVPPGVLNLVIGARETGQALVDGSINGLAFTGSVATGQALHRALADRPEVLLALEMGGNAPLVVLDGADVDDAVNLIVRSAFITTGQRCTCARRLFLPDTDLGRQILDTLVATTTRLRIGDPFADPEVFCGPLISERAANDVRNAVAALVENGAAALCGPGAQQPGTGFIEPTIALCDDAQVPDEEIFGPLLHVWFYDNVDEAFARAAHTRYGLAAGLIGGNKQDFERFKRSVKAGVVNWNAPTTGASGRLPFGGVGASGNHRPAGYTAADFCAYPVASVVNDTPGDAVAPIVGLREGSDT